MSKRHKHSATGTPAPTPSRRTLMYTVASVLLVGLIIALFAASTPSRASLTSSASPERGRTLFTQYCVACHGPSGQGEFNWQNRERAAPPLDSSAHAWHHEDEQLIDMILHKPVPDSRMPAWETILGRADAIDLIAYIKTLWTPYIRDNCQGVKHMSCMGMR